MAKNKEFLKLLIDKDISRPRLAEKLGVTEQTVYYWIIGRNLPSMKYVIHMAKIFKVSIVSLWEMFNK